MSVALPAEHADRAAPPGSPRATALLFARAERRAALTALYALDAEIAAASRPGPEHAPAHEKLRWWRGEVDRLVAGRAEHPIGRALLAGAGSAPDWSLLHERLAAADLRLAAFAPGSVAELEALLYRSHGALQQLAAQVLAGARAPALERFGATLGRGVGLAETLRDVRADARAGLVRLPLESLAAAGVAVESLAGNATPAGLGGVLAPLADRARAALADAAAALPPADRRAQSHGLALAALHAELVERIAASGYDVVARRHALPPFRQLYVAWRAARRA